MADLTTSGSPTLNGNSTVTIDSTGSDRVRAPIALVNATQGWFGIRFVAGATTTDGRILFSWQPDADNMINCWHGSTAASGFYRMYRQATGGGTADAISGANPVSGDHTFIGKWTATQIGASIDGEAFHLVSNDSIPTLSGSYFDIGRLGDVANQGWIDNAIYWCAAGTGTLTDAEALTIHNYGNADPNFVSFPGTITFLWKCVDFTYEDSAAPAGGNQSRYLLTLGVG